MLLESIPQVSKRINVETKEMDSKDSAIGMWLAAAQCVQSGALLGSVSTQEAGVGTLASVSNDENEFECMNSRNL